MKKTKRKQDYKIYSSTNIYLIGPMGSGKTSIGKQLSDLTKKFFYDSDVEIEKHTGMNIPEIFEREGEDRFRKQEVETIVSLCKFNNIILSTGGGSVLVDTNRHHLSKNGIVVYLMITAEIQIKRLSLDKNNRPLFTQYNSKEKILKLNKERESLYKNTANLTYSVDNSTGPRQTAIQILMDINKKIHRFCV
ncbi:shikimate kinase [Coxiella endosymbiont of Amblyomma sculptum]|uniref:shikimate kinase n=1 Tax=Coxiella endosymbiont of Amblyomma sculptum TaxID=2487929 RepID=UPI00132EC930|nr:shikimate kinase [Coxiella endosymbiont of Amblyomma sculptum]QHG92218.1 shikimate kinase [Coxiella endosymbiont of Amblyomma sculptum]